MAKDVLAEVLEITGAKPQGAEHAQVFLERLHKAVDDLPEGKWNKLSTPAQEWYNNSSASVDKKKGYLTLPGVSKKGTEKSGKGEKPEKEAKADKKAKANGKAEKPAKEAKAGKKGKKSKAGRKSKISDTDTIKVLLKEAPSGKLRRQLYGIYKKNKTVAAAIKAGATRSNIAKDQKLGNISLSA